MNDLDQVQAFLAAQLVRKQSLPKDAAISEQARQLVKTTGRLSALERLEIYREQFWLRHTSSLVEDFPGVSGILGQRAWASLIEGYLEAHPPSSFTLRDLGLRFPDYVERQTTLEQYRLCLDMARLELAYIEIFDAADASPVTPEVIAAIPEGAWEHARITFQPALRVLQAAYPVAKLRRELIEARTKHAPVSTTPLPEAQCLLLFRRELQLFHEPISAGALALIRALIRGVPLVLAGEQAQAEVPADAAGIEQNAGAWFQSWAAQGLITHVEV